jgi:hypothetical protein
MAKSARDHLSRLSKSMAAQLPQSGKTRIAVVERSKATENGAT